MPDSRIEPVQHAKAAAGRIADKILGRDWRGSNGEHRSIIVGLVAVGLFAVLGKLASVAKEMAVAWRYGVSPEVDAYLLVFNLVSWPIAVWFGALSVIVIPMAARLRQGPPQALSRFRSELLAVTLLLGGALAGAMLFLLPRLVTSSWLGLPPRTADLALRMVPVMGWLLVPGLLVGLYSTWTMSAGRHANTLLEGVPALCILAGVLAGGGPAPLAWGTLLGTVLQVILLMIPVRLRGDLELPSFTLLAPEWQQFWRGFGIMMLGQAVLSVSSLVDQFFAARLGEGAISSLGYATRVVALIIGIAATAITRATLPVFSRQGAREMLAARRLALRWSGLMALAGLLVVFTGWVLAPWGIQLLFQRGTFTAADSAVVSRLLQFGLLHLPFYFASLVLVSLRSGLGQYRLLLASGFLGLTVKVVSCYLLIPLLGAPALMLSLALVYGANVLLLLGARLP